MTAEQDKRVAWENPLRADALGGVPVVSKDQLAYGWKMYSHFARFMEIRWGQRYFPDQKVGNPPTGAILPIDWDAVRPMVDNPQAKRYDGTCVSEPMKACNRTYTELVDATYASFNGVSDGLRDAVGLMYKLKYQAAALFNTLSPLECEAGQTLGPAFEYLG